MEEGYPGELHVKATYSLTSHNELDMIFEAEGNDKPTIMNMTNHAYWNLSGNCKRTIDNHVSLYFVYSIETVSECRQLLGWSGYGFLVLQQFIVDSI